LQPACSTSTAEFVPPQARLAALYPDFQLCHMPCEAAEPADGWLDDDDEADAPPLSPFVGNAVEAGQACSWHTDFDPFRAPLGSPWEARFGRYGNRQVRPRGRSALNHVGLDVHYDAHIGQCRHGCWRAADARRV